MHRAIAKVQNGGTWYFQTKGDNNNSPDYWSGPETFNGMISEYLLVGKVSEINPSWTTVFFTSNLLMLLSLTVAVLSGIGCLLILAISHARAPLMPTPTAITRICPACRKNLSEFPDDIKACPYCGKKFEPKKAGELN